MLPRDSLRADAPAPLLAPLTAFGAAVMLGLIASTNQLFSSAGVVVSVACTTCAAAMLGFFHELRPSRRVVPWALVAVPAVTAVDGAVIAAAIMWLDGRLNIYTIGYDVLRAQVIDGVGTFAILGLLAGAACAVPVILLLSYHRSTTTSRPGSLAYQSERLRTSRLAAITLAAASASTFAVRSIHGYQRSTPDWFAGMIDTKQLTAAILGAFAVLWLVALAARDAGLLLLFAHLSRSAAAMKPRAAADAALDPADARMVDYGVGFDEFVLTTYTAGVSPYREAQHESLYVLGDLMASRSVVLRAFVAEAIVLGITMVTLTAPVRK
jgi:hypothetical protein